MGHRANCVIVERGIAKIYYTHGGATAIPEWVLVEFPDNWQNIEGWFTPVDTLLEINRAEGGLLIDRDQRRLLFWGGEDIRYTPYLRRPLLSALRALRPNWTIDWAMYGNADLEKALPPDSSNVLVGPFAEGFDPGHAVRDDDLLEDEEDTTIITVRWKEEVVYNYVLGYLPGTILATGPRLLDILLKKQPHVLPHERDEEFEGGALLDLTTHELWVWERAILDPRYLTALEQIWTGWHVSGHVEGIVRQVSLSGRDPVPIAVPHEECATRLVKALGPVTFPGHLTAEEQQQVVQQIFHAPSS